jgi:hypothetical protein
MMDVALEGVRRWSLRILDGYSRTMDQLRAVSENVVVAECRCHDDWRKRHVTNMRDDAFPSPVMPHRKVR